MLSERGIQNLTGAFEALGGTVRIRLLEQLAQRGEMSVTDLCKRLKLKQPAASHHLALLRLKGLIRGRRDGKRKLYVVNRLTFEGPARFLRQLRGVERRSPSGRKGA